MADRGSAQARPEAFRLTVHVHPSSRRTQVGGSYGEALVVRVHEPAADQRATRATVAALAAAFGVSDRDVRVVRGAQARTKLVEIDIDPLLGAATLDRLRAGA